MRRNAMHMPTVQQVGTGRAAHLHGAVAERAVQRECDDALGVGHAVHNRCWAGHCYTRKRCLQGEKHTPRPKRDPSSMACLEALPDPASTLFQQTHAPKQHPPTATRPKPLPTGSLSQGLRSEAASCRSQRQRSGQAPERQGGCQQGLHLRAHTYLGTAHMAMVACHHRRPCLQV